jgi:hypothetical protein
LHDPPDQSAPIQDASAADRQGHSGVARPARNDHRLPLTRLHAQQASHPRAEQHPRLARDGTEHLRWRRLAGDERRHAPQRRVLA